MTAKTNLDLHLSATDAAQKALNYETDFEVETGKIESFKADQNDPVDWVAWNNMFTERLGHFKLLATQPAPSVLAAKNAAQTAAAKIAGS